MGVTSRLSGRILTAKVSAASYIAEHDSGVSAIVVRFAFLFFIEALVDVYCF